jgi:hypothetical protein
MRRLTGLALAVLAASSLDAAALPAQEPAPGPSAPPSEGASADPATALPPASSSVSASQAQTPAASSAQPLPVDLDRIRQQVTRPPAVKLDEQQLRFYVLVLAKQPKIDDFIGDYDLKNGPTKGGAAMTHQEFLNMVTPRALDELFGATSGSSFAMLQAVAVNVAAQSLIKKAIEEIRAARTQHEIQAIRERIDRELAALLGKSDK